MSAPVSRLPATALARWLPALAMLAGSALLYLPPGLTQGATLRGIDYGQLHRARLEYVATGLGEGALPGWFTRELLGMPFLANVANFPWNPSHLFLLPWDPAYAYVVAVALASVLASAFTYLFCREVGAGRIGSALAGFTFVAAGFLASRVLAGHLTLIEAYPALPLLLWLVERAHRKRARSGTWPRPTLVALAAAAAATALAGHPQLPAYALVAASLYALGRGRGGAWPVATMAAGAALTFVVWIPMLLLVGESARALGLPPHPQFGNDIPFPLWRLDAFVWPWADGWPGPVPGRERPFVHANVAYFWDTVCYVGLLPLAATVGLGLDALARRRAPSRPAALLIALGVGALVLALPWVHALQPQEMILLRSPSRQIYVTTFALCAALAFGMTRLRAYRPRRGTAGAAAATGIALLAAFHVFDVSRHARVFVLPERAHRELPPELAHALETGLETGRVAVSVAVHRAMLRDRDRVGFFDATPLARSFVALHRLAGARLEEREILDGSVLPAAALAAVGARFVVTTRSRADLPLHAERHGIRLYRVPGARPRAAFFPSSRIDYVARPLALRPAREGADPPRLRLVEGAPRPGGPARGAAAGALAARELSVHYARPSPDRIQVALEGAGPGYVRVLESWSAGWSARVDGATAPVLPGDGFALAVPVEAGARRVELHYATPGRGAGWLLSAVAAAGLAAIVVVAGRASSKRP